MNRIKNACLAILLTLSFNAHASIINVAGNPFSDFGNFTVDLTSNLEWLDVTATAGRSYCDVNSDIQDQSPSLACGFSSDTFGVSEGWRYATSAEFEQLVSNFFAVDYQGTFNSPFGGLTDIPFIEQFISLFGDTLAFDYDSQLFPESRTELEGSGYIRGILADDMGIDAKIAGDVEDFQVFDLTNNVPLYDYADQISNTNSYSIEYRGNEVGHWLVRDTHLSSVPVSEAPSLALFLIALGAFLQTRKKRRYQKA